MDENANTAATITVNVKKKRSLPRRECIKEVSPNALPISPVLRCNSTSAIRRSEDAIWMMCSIAIIGETGLSIAEIKK